MELINTAYRLRSSSRAEAKLESSLIIEDLRAEPYIQFLFPDRTPRDKLEAVAKAINDALDAAREVEGAGRD